jgi:hypothetical protein
VNKKKGKRQKSIFEQRGIRRKLCEKKKAGSALTNFDQPVPTPPRSFNGTIAGIGDVGIAGHNGAGSDDAGTHV